MSFEQFTYTGSPWGFSAPGWTVFQTSAGINLRAAVELKPYFQFREPATGGDGGEEFCNVQLPVQLVFAIVPESGLRIVAQSLDAGLRWYDQTRGRDYFAHVLVESRPGAAFENVAASFNPVALFLSPDFQICFPDELRDKALQIFHGEIPNEPTPELPQISSTFSFAPNPALEDELLFERLPDRAITKLGALVAAMASAKPAKNCVAFFFDATRAASIDTMAAATRLIPLSKRTGMAFTTWLPSGDAKSPLLLRGLLFAGTCRQDEDADPDTGLYGELPQGGPEFRSREDVELFKRMVDAGGTALGAEDFDALVSCWEVAAGRKADVGSLRAAAKFAERFPGMKDEVASGLAGALADYNYGSLPREMKIAGVVAGYELGFESFRSDISGTLDEFIRDGGLFSEALRTLDGDAARATFLDAVFDDARDSSALVDLAEMLRGLDGEARRIANAAAPNGRMAKFAECIDRMEGIRLNVKSGHVPAASAQATLDEIDAAEDEFGPVFGDIEEARNALRYLIALDGLHGIDGLAAFADEAKSLGVDAGKIRYDVLERVNPGNIPPERLIDALDEFNVVGVSKSDVLRLAVEAAERRGRENGERSARMQVRTDHCYCETAEPVVKCGIPAWCVAIIAFLSLIMGLSAGVVVASRFASRNGDDRLWKQATFDSIPLNEDAKTGEPMQVSDWPASGFQRVSSEPLYRDESKSTVTGSGEDRW